MRLLAAYAAVPLTAGPLGWTAAGGGALTTVGFLESSADAPGAGAWGIALAAPEFSGFVLAGFALAEGFTSGAKAGVGPAGIAASTFGAAAAPEGFAAPSPFAGGA